MVQKGKKTFVPAREIQFNCKPVSDADIEEFCRDYIQYYPDSLTKTEREKQIKMMIRAIKTVCQTPTGRMAFRATCYNIQQHRAQNPKYRLTVCFAGKSEDSVGSVNVDDSNCICLYQDTMREIWEKRFCTFRKRSNFPDDISLTDKEKEKAFYLELGWVFFHEAQHVRQLQNPQLQGQLTHLFLDAAPQALARQIILESDSRISQWCLNITNSEVQAYRRAVDFNPETLAFDEQKAVEYSRNNQRDYIKDFIFAMDKKPFIHYGYICTRWNYLKPDVVLAHIYPEWVQKETGYKADVFRPASKDPLLASLMETHNLPVTGKFNLADYAGPKLKEQGKEIQEHLTVEERATLALACITEEDLDESKFQGTSKKHKIELAKKYMQSLKELKDLLGQLEMVSEALVDNPNNQKALKKSKEIRTQLKEQFGLVMETFNQYDQRIAIYSKTKTQPDVSIRNISVPCTLGINDLLAQNAQNVVPLEDDNHHHLPSENERIS